MVEVPGVHNFPRYLHCIQPRSRCCPSEKQTTYFDERDSTPGQTCHAEYGPADHKDDTARCKEMTCGGLSPE